MAAGYASAHLAQWVAAARLISAAVRRWLHKRALARSLARIHAGVAAVVRLQARWRARPLRRSFVQLQATVRQLQVRCTEKTAQHSAAQLAGCAVHVTMFHATLRCCQAIFRGNRTRRLVFNTLRAPKLLENCIRRTQELRMHRYVQSRCPLWRTLSAFCDVSGKSYAVPHNL